MNYDFDEPLNRKGTCSLKHDILKEVFGREDIIPLWIADMDFKAPDFILDSFMKRVNHGSFGYSILDEAYYDAVTGWLKRRHNWNVSKESICFSPGIVPALNFATLAYTKPGDSIIIQTPVYPPFYSSVKSHGRNLVENRLVEKNGRWYMDFQALEACIDETAKMLILCNPHNPVGRVWTREELMHLADICLKHGIIIVSDDIHSDLSYPDYTYLPVATLGKAAADNSITCISASKTFNVAGLSTSSVIIPNNGLRKKFLDITEGLHIAGSNIFGPIATIEAFNKGDEWLDGLVEYIVGNARFVKSFLAEHVPEIIPVDSEATFLMWLDCRNLGFKGHELQRFFVEKAGVGMNEGSDYGIDGDGFMRMNIGTQRKVLEQALEQIAAAVKTIRK